MRFNAYVEFTPNVEFSPNVEFTSDVQLRVMCSFHVTCEVYTQAPRKEIPLLWYPLRGTTHNFQEWLPGTRASRPNSIEN
jgi:hypothetical protein